MTDGAADPFDVRGEAVAAHFDGTVGRWGNEAGKFNGTRP